MSEDFKTEGWTYGAEHELADWPRDCELPEGFRVDERDYTIVNSNGIAADPTGRHYRFGGEICTPPTDSVLGQVGALQAIKERYPEAKVNYRSNLHPHVRVPGLGNDLLMLKQVQRYIHENMPKVLPQIEPIHRPREVDFLNEERFRGALRRWRRRRVSHHTLLKPDRLEHQLAARTLQQFYEREVPAAKKDGKPLWHCQARLCVNLRQHRETDTVEFRHFPGTLDVKEFKTAMSWCRDFLVWAIDGRPIETLLGKKEYRPDRFPTFPEYQHDVEERYRMTTHDGTVDTRTILANIEMILEMENG